MGNGQNETRVGKWLSRNMRLTYLPDEYFDSFTISSIINGFETGYVKKVIDPLVNEGLHIACARLLEEYDTTYNEDLAEIQEVEAEREGIYAKMEQEDADVQALQDELWGLETLHQVLEYRMREKGNLMDCSYLEILL